MATFGKAKKKRDINGIDFEANVDFRGKDSD